jgi:hypothetical protein
VWESAQIYPTAVEQEYLNLQKLLAASWSSFPATESACVVHPHDAPRLQPCKIFEVQVELAPCSVPKPVA